MFEQALNEIDDHLVFTGQVIVVQNQHAKILYVDFHLVDDLDRKTCRIRRSGWRG